jgi:LacI family transcriptional regulator
MATINEIALRAGVSKGTVSNILNGKNKENRPTAIAQARRIRELAEEMGYRPNASARAVSQGRYGSLALLFSENIHRGSQFRGTLRAIMTTARQMNQRLSVTGLTDEVFTDESLLAVALREMSADGLLINYIQDAPGRMTELLHKFRIPAVWINTLRDDDCVYPDDFRAARVATRHLIALGHRRIAYYNPMPSDHYSQAARQDGYKAALAEAGLRATLWMGPSHREARPIPLGEWQDVTRHWLTAPGGERPTGFICYDPPRAYTLYAAACAVGLRVPADLSLITFDELPVDGIGVEITTSLIPAEDMGRQAVRMLLRKVEDSALSLPPTAVPHLWYDGQTCAPPPAP